MTPDTIRVVVAEDHETVREGLRHLLNAQGDMEVVGEAGNGRTAIEQACLLKPDVVVIDLSMPEMNGLVAVQHLRESLPSAALVALTRHNDKTYVRQLTAAGALAYVLKQSSSNELLSAIRAAAAGQRYIDTALRDAFDTPSKPQGRTGITERETEVLRLMSVGQGNKQIASSLGISVKTVEVHKANAMRKLNLAGRTDVVRYAAMQGWLQDP
jgi:two-component system, NarL family, response regulator NreC